MDINQQTAVEWLLDWMGQNQYFIGDDLLDAVYQAKQLEEENLTVSFFTKRISERLT